MRYPSELFHPARRVKHEERLDALNLIFDRVYSAPRVIDLEAEVRGHGNWQFYVAADQGLKMGNFASLMHVSRPISQWLRNHFFRERRFELVIVSGPPPLPARRIADPHSMIKRITRLELDLTPSRDTRVRSDVRVQVIMKANATVERLGVKIEPIDRNRPFGVTEEEIDWEANGVRLDLRDRLWEKAPNDRRLDSALLAELLTVMDDGMERWGVLAGREWWKPWLKWMNHVNLGDEDVEMEDEEGEEREESESEGSEMSVDEVM